jgi:hypothetical protein
LGRDLSPADCGEQRQSQIACPADCPHNPFGPANYSQSLAIEDSLDMKCKEQLAAQAPDCAAMSDLSQVNPNDINAIHAGWVWNLFFDRDANQTTFAQRWEQTGWTGLKNDERVLQRAKMQMRWP